MITDPDYARIYTQARIMAWQYGFACVAHGTFTRDLDLVLIPWEERATDSTAEQVIRMLADACDLHPVGTAPPLKFSDPLPFGIKPHGRRSVSLMLPGAKERRWVDLGVMPCRPAERPPTPAAGAAP